MTVRKMFAKRCLTLTLPALLFVLVNSLAYGGWVSVDPPHIYGPFSPPTENWNLFGVHFSSASKGMAVGKDDANIGAVLLLYSGGVWTQIQAPKLYPVEPYFLTGVHLIQENYGWAVGQNFSASKGVILFYHGGLLQPYYVNPPVSDSWFLSRVYFNSPTEGWAVGGDTTNPGKGIILRWDNDQSQWTNVSISNPYPEDGWGLFDVHFPSSSEEGWAVGWRFTSFVQTSGQKGVLLHRVLKSVPGAAGPVWVWEAVEPPEVESNHWVLWGVHFTSPEEGWAVGQDYDNKTGVLLHYLNGSWEFVPAPNLDTPNWGLIRVHFTSPNNGWAVGGPTILHYSNGEWSPVDPPNVNESWGLRDVFFTSAGNGWAVGEDNISNRGVLLHYHLSFALHLKDIIIFFDYAVSEGSLQGSGPGSSAQGRLKALRNMIASAGNLIEMGDLPKACQQLMDAYNRTDGKPKPPEFAAGDAAPELAVKIWDLMKGMECTGM